MVDLDERSTYCEVLWHRTVDAENGESSLIEDGQGLLRKVPHHVVPSRCRALITGEEAEMLVSLGENKFRRNMLTYSDGFRGIDNHL